MVSNLVCQFLFFSVNVTGVKNEVKRKSLFLFLQNKRADFYFIQESHSSEGDGSHWRSQWGSNGWFSHGSNRSAGVAILQGEGGGQIIKHDTDKDGRWIILLADINQSLVILINIYASNSKSLNNIIFSTIENKLNQWLPLFPSAEILWGGDFNTVFDESLQNQILSSVRLGVNEKRNLAIRLSRRISRYNKEKELQRITQIIPLSEKSD